MHKAKKIPINIWDDYWDDGYVPEGDCQKTYAYIELYDVLTEKEQNEVMSFLYDYIIALNLPDAPKIELLGANIDFENITHKFRESMVKILQDAKLEWCGIPLDIYSES